MKGMDGDKYYITILIRYLDNLLDASSIVLHPHKTTENSNAVIDMDHVVSHIEGTQIINSQLFTLLNTSSYAYPVESVEYFVVGVTTYLIFRIYETLVNVSLAYKFRNYAAVLEKD